MRKRLCIPCVAVVCLALGSWFVRELIAEPSPAAAPNKLAIVWTSGDPEVAHRMVFMYLHASQKSHWFDENLLIVWGPSSRLLAADKDLQAEVKQMMADGVQVNACITCAESYGVVDELRALGIEVKSMGRPLTDLVKSDRHMLTF